jgi:hypothetical protein
MQNKDAIKDAIIKKLIEENNFLREENASSLSGIVCVGRAVLA